MTVERIVNSFLQSNTFILSSDGENDVYIVDIGDVEPILNRLNGRKVAALLLTHAHYDHIYGINELLARFPECKVYGSNHTLSALKNDKLNFSYYYDKPLSYKQGNEQIVENGSRIILWKDTSIKAMITPGHTPGSTCYTSQYEMFTGDAYIPNLTTVTKLKEGNKVLAEKSVKIIKDSLTEGMRLYPGHLCQYLINNNQLDPLR